MDWFKKKFEQAAPVVARGIRGAVEAVNPFDDESRGNKLVDQTQRSFGGTNEFKSILDRANPKVSNQQLGQGSLQQGASSAGQFGPKQGYSNLNSRLWINQAGSDQESTMLHEGLHGAWDESPENVRGSYLEAVQTALPPADTDPNSLINQAFRGQAPDPRSWLQQRSNQYTSAKGETFQDVRNLNPDMQTEMHSFLPEYYEQYKKPMPASLQAYYSRFYTPGRQQQRSSLAYDIMNFGRQPQRDD